VIVSILHSDDELFDKDVIQKIVKKFEDKDINILFSNLIYTKENDSSVILRK
jgi:hypothetical protein